MSRTGLKALHLFPLFILETSFLCCSLFSIFLNFHNITANWGKSKVLFNISASSFKLTTFQINMLALTSLTGYEGHAPPIQYLPNKHHHHFGFKLFCLCKSENGYIIDFTIYEGKGFHVSEHGISSDTGLDKFNKCMLWFLCT